MRHAARGASARAGARRVGVCQGARRGSGEVLGLCHLVRPIVSLPAPPSRQHLGKAHSTSLSNNASRVSFLADQAAEEANPQCRYDIEGRHNITRRAQPARQRPRQPTGEHPMTARLRARGGEKKERKDGERRVRSLMAADCAWIDGPCPPRCSRSDALRRSAEPSLRGASGKGSRPWAASWSPSCCATSTSQAQPPARLAGAGWRPACGVRVYVAPCGIYPPT